MPHDINGFKELKFEDTVKNQKVYIAGNLKNGVPTKVYGPHFMHDPKKHLLESSMNGKIFFDDWHCVYTPKKKIVKIKVTMIATVEGEVRNSDKNIMEEFDNDFFYDDAMVIDMEVVESKELPL